jgi:ABC-type transport system involved in multi-copper enzyme maturation permease subunit
MLTVLGIELEKLARQRKSWLALLVLNCVGLLLLVALWVLPALVFPEDFQAKTAGSQASIDLARRVLAATIVLWANTFSLLATLVLTALAGAVFAAEYADDSIQMLLLAPVRRIQVWAGKVLALVLVYGAAWAVGLGLMLLSYQRLVSLDGDFAGQLWEIPVGELLGTYVLLDLTTLAFFCTVSAASRGGVGATIGGIGAYVVLIVGNLILQIVGAMPFFGETPRAVELWAEYGFPAAVQVASLTDVTNWVLKPTGAFPVESHALWVSAGWLAFFLAASAGIFCFRESRPES